PAPRQGGDRRPGDHPGVLIPDRPGAPGIGKPGRRIPAHGRPRAGVSAILRRAEPGWSPGGHEVASPPRREEPFMTAPTRPPRASQPYPVAEAPEPEHTDGGWASVLVAAIVAAVAIAVAGVIAGLVVVNLRESTMSESPRGSTQLTSSPVAAAPAGQIPEQLEITVPTEAPEAPVAPVTTVAAEIDTLDQASVQDGVVTVLTGSYGLTE